ncbi:MAG: serine/threonine-protein kinase [Myxococcota bacterium]
MSETPAQVGPYTPQQLLALGGQSMVWLGSGPEGPVALKIARTDDGRRGLAREIEILRTHRHPNLVALRDADPDGEWLALERVDGASADLWATEGSAGTTDQPRRSIDEVVDLGLQLVEVLAHLHAAGVVHGDLKPSNVMVTPQGVAKLIDLGVATTAGEKVEGFRGTLGFAAPELLNGKAPSVATDVYGLGALLYAVLVGRGPFVAPDPAALTYLPLVSLPPPPSTFRPELPAPLNQLLLGMLARTQDRRPDLAKVRDGLAKGRSALPGPPVLGMADEREELRRAVVGAADGEPRIVVLYGVAGSGRRTLIAEAVEYARREGMPYLRGTDPQGAIPAIREAGAPSVLVMKAQHRGARQLAETVLKDKLGCLVLLHADRPVAGLSAHGAIQLTPSPLSASDASRLAQVWSADASLAEDWWRKSMGLPIAILGRIRAWRRDHGQSVTQHAPLPAESRKIYDALRNRPKMKSLVLELAAELQMTEHLLLDHCEVLFAEGLLEPADDGLSVVVTRARSVV